MPVGRVSCAIVALLAFGWGARGARAQTLYPPVTNRNFNIDLFQQPVIGPAHLIAMSRALNPITEGTMGLYANPASVAVRPDIHIAPLSLSGYLAAHSAYADNDVDNTGLPSTYGRRSALISAGTVLWAGKWGLALDAGYGAYEMRPPGGMGLSIQGLIPRLVVSRTLLGESLAIGVGISGSWLNVRTRPEHTPLFWRMGLSLEGGVLLKPTGMSFRIGLHGLRPIYNGTPRFSCDPLSCYGYIIPLGVVTPWSAVLGFGYRFGRTAWNRPPTGNFRDERAVIIAASLSVVGPVADGYGIDAYAAKQLQPTRNEITRTPRLGIEGEVLPGWLRLRAGAYLEGSRFPGAAERMHGTGGAEVRLFSFFLWTPHRVSLSFAGDWASNFDDFGVSLGFWE